MAQKTNPPKTNPKGRSALYPNGWPKNLRGGLYLNNKKRRLSR